MRPRRAVAVIPVVVDAGQRRIRLPSLGPAIGCLAAVALLAACSSGNPAISARGGTSTTISTAATDSSTETAVLAAWRGAENAIYQAGEDPRGLYSPTLAATLVDPELQLVRRSLAGDEHDGFIGRGTWDLGIPTVIQLGPTQAAPTMAVVASCVHDSEIIVRQSDATPASGLSGEPNWAGLTSTMVLTAGTWKLSQQSAVANTSRATACAAINS